MSPEPHGPAGSVEQEASRLLDAAAAWLGRAATDGDERDDDRYGAGPPPAAEPAPDSSASTDGGQGRQHRCTGCPLCRGRTLFEDLGADTFDQLADLVGSVADSLRAVAEDRRRAGPAAADTDPDGSGDGRRP